MSNKFLKKFDVGPIQREKRERYIEAKKKGFDQWKLDEISNNITAGMQLIDRGGSSPKMKL